MKTIHTRQSSLFVTGSMLLASAKVDREKNTATEDDDKPAKKKPKKKAHKPKWNWVNTDLACGLAPWIPVLLTWIKLKQKNYYH